MPKEKSGLAPRKTAHQDRARLRVETILQSTKTLLNEHPSHQVNTRMIADHAGISIGSLYQYFPKKEAIFYELFRQWLEATLAELDRVNDSLSPDATYEECVEAFLRGLTNPELNSQSNWKLRFAMSSSKELAALEEKHKVEVAARVHKIKQQFGSSPPPELAMPMLLLQNEYTVASLITLSHMAGTPFEEKMYQMCKKLLLIVFDYDRWENLPAG
ncbi:TetR/AcrR family transcriptional regulator [Loktanella sp. S4079]|uniref:TetR/AcrR family transcriptional regulator n=1 Tax=Loktanella sp. S4079 TaxID=579483 RepID=UPI00069602DD|nr:TetR/AcrR family transcriptional regulator [Loktanella sp. S4079]